MASDTYLKLKDIEGESTDDKHKGEIELLGFSKAVSMAINPRSSQGSPTTEKVSVGDVSVEKYVDSASPLLFKAACQGQPIGEAIISVNRTDGKGGKIEYLKYTLSDVIISSYQVSGSQGGSLPVESFSLNYGKLKAEYQATDPATGASKGTKSGGWDVGANKPI